MDSSTYRHLIGQFKKSTTIPHHNFPSHNLISLETLVEVSRDLNSHESEIGNEFLSTFPCYQPFPYIVKPAVVLHPGSGLTDDARELVKKKLNWEKKLKNLRLSNIDGAVASIKKMTKNKPVVLSGKLKEYIELFHNDPEPMFNGKYNWLYTGGCLSHDDGVLITSDFSLDKRGCYLLKLNKTQNDIEEKTFFEVKSTSPILQITSASHNNNLIICARQNNFINLFKSTDGFQPIKLWRKKVRKPKLLTCTSVKRDLDEVIVTDSNHDVHVFNLETKSNCFGFSGTRISSSLKRDSWSQVAFGSLGIYWALRRGFVILDERFQDSSSRLKPDYELSSTTDSCEDIYSFIESPTDSNYIYLSTTHSVLQVDLRQKKAVQKWTHLMKNPPQYMAASKRENGSEVLILQTQSVDEVCGIINERHNSLGSFVSKSLPCLLGNVRDSFRFAQLNGFCLSPFVSKRADFSVTGVTCVRNGKDELLLFTCNAGGDVFVSKIAEKSEKESESDEEMIRRMKEFELHVEGMRKGLNCNLEVVDMRDVVEAIPKRRKPQRKREVYWKYNEIYSPESLLMCKDVLAGKILKVWGHQDVLSDSEAMEMSVDDKVLEWMNKC